MKPDEMSEVEKLDAGLPYDITDEEVNARKIRAMEICQKLNNTPQLDENRYEIIEELFGETGENITICPGFNCDNGLNIKAGDYFLANYNVTILDIAPVTIGDYVMIGPNTMISTVGHPLNPKGRREQLGIAKPIKIGNDVWIGGGVTILPGVTIGNNVVVGAGAIVTKDIEDNSLVVGVPAKKIKDLENDVD